MDFHFLQVLMVYMRTVKDENFTRGLAKKMAPPLGASSFSYLSLQYSTILMPSPLSLPLCSDSLGRGSRSTVRGSAQHQPDPATATRRAAERDTCLLLQVQRSAIRQARKARDHDQAMQ